MLGIKPPRRFLVVADELEGSASLPAINDVRVDSRVGSLHGSASIDLVEFAGKIAEKSLFRMAELAHEGTVSLG
jgi:hypothetical protein